ncbi:prohibitin family protein [Spirosoma montaniterrae]|uniref:Spfh domain, band 7 family protein n=1 Tax=Spirosoma montaniterrae TaxID=1178516 RepID=A0A1P9WZR7_9BACT|nr:prohibitin family protein [Spirosoma montaniterrae]AQG80835.1 spfh domain, band 7 family protein [Spirosoma montaniterrae]
MKTHGIILSVGLSLLVLSSCTVVRQGEVGVKRTLGKIKPAPLMEGAKGFNPLVTTIIKVPTRTMNIEVRQPLPSKEGLTVQSDVSILYRVDGQQAPKIIEQIGRSYEEVVILPVFRSAVADISSRYYAKDMHTGQRAEIEKAIRELMMTQLKGRGFEIESVLLKSIALPAGLSRAIEEKLNAEQDAQRMQFVLDKERQEAQRRVIEAEGIRDSQKIINEGLTPMLIKFKTIEAFNKLSTSPNSKIIVTSGDSPLMLSADKM